ncbi:MAG TPA: response regulator [Desulfuromonadaceae bacterium]
MDREKNVKILFVDDEKNVLRSLERIFMDDEYEIFTANSGDEGLQILKEQGVFQIVISDYRMPGMNGVEFLKEVYSLWPDTVRIVLSGYADTGSIVAAVNEGHIYKFIPKPWNEEELKVTIANSLERFTLQLRNRELMAELSRYNEELERKVQERTADLELRNNALAFAQSMLNALPVAVIGIDSSGMVVQGNRKAIDLFSAVNSGILGADYSEALPQEFCRVIDSLTNNEIVQMEWAYQDVCFDVRFTAFSSFGQQGMVIVLIDEKPA